LPFGRTRLHETDVVLTIAAIVASLVEVFEAAGRHAAEDRVPCVRRPSESELLELCARGRGAHPDLALDDAAFVAYLGRCDAALNGSFPDATDPNVGDLFLACAALAAVPGAVARLRERHRPHLARALRRFGSGEAFVEEVEQRLWDGLLVGRTGAPRLAAYSGTGPLERWLSVAAQRIAITVMRHEDAESRARNEAAAQAQFLGPDPEIEAIRVQYQRPFQRAVDVAVLVLDDREKVLYRMHFVQKLTLEQIGKAYGVHHTTVLRWLRAAGDRVLEQVKRLLRSELDLAQPEFDSLVRLLISQLDLDISNVLDRAS
jgi:RNA polymerase sigma-70 factor (ECF subfamily)